MKLKATEELERYWRERREGWRGGGKPLMAIEWKNESSKVGEGREGEGEEVERDNEKFVHEKFSRMGKRTGRRRCTELVGEEQSWREMGDGGGEKVVGENRWAEEFEGERGKDL